MTASLGVKRLLARFYCATGLTGRRLAARRGSVLLAYHRVLPRSEWGGRQPGMVVSPATLAANVRFLKRHFDILPLAEAVRRAGSDRGRPACALTFDDGWRDFLLHAWPVLGDAGVPAVVFLPTDLIGSAVTGMWPDRLADLLGRGEAPAPPGGSAEPAAVELARGWAALRGPRAGRLEVAVALGKPHRADVIEAALELLGASRAGDTGSGRAFLNWAEVRELAATGRVVFGSHTASHALLPLLEEPDMDRELSRSRDRLRAEGVLDPGADGWFCYPNGDHDDRVVARVRAAGYSLAVTTRRGWVEPGADLLRLSRVCVHDDVAGHPALFACRLAGVPL